MANKWKNKPVFTAWLLAILLTSCDEKPEVVYTRVDGVYTCSEESVHLGYRKYIIEIDRVGETGDQYIISNFHNSGQSEFLYCMIRNDSLVIADQVIGNLFVNGRGTISEDYREIEVFYFVDDGVVELDYNAHFER